ncbi:MAG: NAD(P)/FAD-dependent oxidoreductase, partial [Candidatus Marinimicrobia bacterium]|nr:NAD(P)/FAD-dependent oxidoreductase [Candidatus Neomarinimicrobiota bacterium]
RRWRSSMKTEWDIIVVGGGPAGIFAALEAAKAGASVLLFERKREMGIPVRCGEAVGKVDFHSYTEVDPRWISTEINTFVMVLPNGKEVKLKSNIYAGYIINRDLFEYDMAARAAAAGACIRMRSNVCDLLKNVSGEICGVRVEKRGTFQEYHARIVIAADGVESRIARQAGIASVLNIRDIEPCVQATLSGVDIPEKALYLYVGTCYAPGGYAWVFPKANRCANVGLGINGKYSKRGRNAESYLQDFLKRFFPEASVQRYVSGGVPVSTNLETLSLKNLLITGDAGHMVNPLNGGGITHAIESGIRAGKAAAGACRNPGKMQSLFDVYEKDIYRRFGKNHESQYRIKELVYQMNDEEYNRIGEEVLKIDLKKRSFLAVFRKVVKEHPGFLADVLRAFTGI